eukprot:8458770-Pyramimonas_sp.AAC.1
MGPRSVSLNATTGWSKTSADREGEPSKSPQCVTQSPGPRQDEVPNSNRSQQQISGPRRAVPPEAEGDER